MHCTPWTALQMDDCMLICFLQNLMIALLFCNSEHNKSGENVNVFFQESFISEMFCLDFSQQRPVSAQSWGSVKG